MLLEPHVGTAAFSYDEAFSRNVGWLTRAEQTSLRGKRVAIAGLGGVGGHHLLTLARLGVGAFHLADFDTFDLVNFNRQAGAGISNLARSKVSVMADLVRDINPEADIRVFGEGLNDANAQDFFAGANLFLDGLDFFALPARRLAFRVCEAAQIPALTAAPLGMGAALLAFLPGGMSFERYFQFQDDELDALRFLLGLAPSGLQFGYLADPSAVDLEGRRGPSTVIGCELCAGIAATEALKILLGRGQTVGAPYGLHYDAYRQRLVRTWRPGGNRHPLQRLALWVARRRLSRPRGASHAC